MLVMVWYLVLNRCKNGSGKGGLQRCFNEKAKNCTARADGTDGVFKEMALF